MSPFAFPVTSVRSSVLSVQVFFTWSGIESGEIMALDRPVKGPARISEGKETR